MTAKAPWCPARIRPRSSPSWSLPTRTSCGRRSTRATLAEILGGAYAQGLRATWSGNSPTWNYQLLATDLGPIADEVYWHSTYTALWDAVDTQV